MCDMQAKERIAEGRDMIKQEQINIAHVKTTLDRSSDHLDRHERDRRSIFLQGTSLLAKRTRLIADNEYMIHECVFPGC